MAVSKKKASKKKTRRKKTSSKTKAEADKVVEPKAESEAKKPRLLYSGSRRKLKPSEAAAISKD